MNVQEGEVAMGFPPGGSIGPWQVGVTVARVGAFVLYAMLLRALFAPCLRVDGRQRVGGDGRAPMNDDGVRVLNECLVRALLGSCSRVDDARR